jgi:CCR4-NOT transcription complex subunit 2
LHIANRALPFFHFPVIIPPQDLNSLALGTDLTGFGLNLNSADSLFPTFASPFTDQALTPDPQFRTPACYHMHPPSLKGEHLSKFQLETLFYMFYSMPKDILQAFAAQELYRREWRFHGELKVWLKPRAPHELMQSHPSVMFVFFDVAGWETRLFTTARGPGVVQALLSEEEVRVKVAPAVSS